MWPVQKEGAGRRQKSGPQSSWESAKASWGADTRPVPCPVTRTELEDWPVPEECCIFLILTSEADSGCDSTKVKGGGEG